VHSNPYFGKKQFFLDLNQEKALILDLKRQLFEFLSVIRDVFKNLANF